jgi:hypothetical protein
MDFPRKTRRGAVVTQAFRKIALIYQLTHLLGKSAKMPQNPLISSHFLSSQVADFWTARPSELQVLRWALSGDGSDGLEETSKK